MKLPEDFVNRVKEDDFLPDDLLTALETVSPVAVRLNPFKTKPELPFKSQLPWSENGWLLSERPKFTLDPLFHAGCYYPQEAGSQLLESVLKQLPLPASPVILDLCAAPGGKSTLIGSFLNNSGLLVSNEVIGARSKVLKENMTKWGIANSVVTNNDPADFRRLPGLFDCIVADAPCSGEGMFRKDHAAREEWSEANVQLCSARQKRILADVWDALKEGGFMIYSTCTFNEAENEDNVRWLARELGAEIVSIQLSQAREGRSGIGHYALPSDLDTEGFYIAVLQKITGVPSQKKDKKQSALQTVKDASQARTLADTEGMAVVQWSDFWFAVLEEYQPVISLIHQQLRVIKLGTEIGQPARKELIPNEALALSPFVRGKNVPHAALERDQALAYLRGDTFPLEGKQGFLLASYNQEPLGWIKHLGNRFNNLYPKDWRIRMDVRSAG
jgi:16S rRNA C967 or C1407 C5-methylase (RsmB/RsmF family)/NOL1/NOP2/fmu family ribosome biogenesis protein